MEKREEGEWGLSSSFSCFWTTLSPLQIGVATSNVFQRIVEGIVVPFCYIFRKFCRFDDTCRFCSALREFIGRRGMFVKAAKIPEFRWDLSLRQSQKEFSVQGVFFPTFLSPSTPANCGCFLPTSPSLFLLRSSSGSSSFANYYYYRVIKRQRSLTLLDERTCSPSNYHAVHTILLMKSKTFWFRSRPSVFLLPFIFCFFRHSVKRFADPSSSSSSVPLGKQISSVFPPCFSVKTLICSLER